MDLLEKKDTSGLLLVLLGLFTLTACGQSIEKIPSDSLVETVLVDTGIKNDNQVIQTRFKTPDGYWRKKYNQKHEGYQEYLRTLPLKPIGSKVHLYNGEERYYQGGQAGVIDLPIGKKDLQQCADAAMRLRAEYLWKTKQYDKIHFNFTNGFVCDYDSYRKGLRVKVNGNKCTWVQGAKPSDDYVTFWRYLELVFTYAGSLSLSKELKSVPVSEVKTGDLFIHGGSPGHVCIVVDVCENIKGKKQFMLAQSFMPAQEIHVLKNLKTGGVWYSTDFALSDSPLTTPEYLFDKTELMRFRD